MTKDLVDTVKAFIAANQTGPNASGNEMGAAEPAKRLGYAARAALSQNQCAKDLWAPMERKRTNLCLSADGHRGGAPRARGPARPGDLHAQDALRPLPRL